MRPTFPKVLLGTVLLLPAGVSAGASAPLRHASPAVSPSARAVFPASMSVLPAEPVSAASPAAVDDNWPAFLGPRGMPVADHPDLPDSWSVSENVEWAAEIPGMGWSSPIVWDGKVFLTSADSDQEMKQPSPGVDFSNDYVAELQAQGLPMDEVIARVTARDNELPDEVVIRLALRALDLETGELLWEREVYSGNPPVGRHRKNSFASETPVTDGEAVYVYIAHLGLYAFTLDGEPLWTTPLEAHPVYLDFGGGTSPALHGDRIFILNDNEGDSFVAAFDRRTGAELWRTARPGLGYGQRKSGWASPFVWENDARTELVTLGPSTAISYDLEGNELWRMSGMSQMPIPTPVARDGLLYLAAGLPGEPNRPIVAIRPGAGGDITLPEGQTSSEHVAWYDWRGGTYLSTPIVYQGALYVLHDKGIFNRYDARTGELVYRARIAPGAANFTASPWAYNGKIFCLSEEGDTYVIGTGDEYELLGVNSLDEFSMATPAIVGDRLLIRTQQHLYSIRGAPEGL